jgi:hypothetical protein
MNAWEEGDEIILDGYFQEDPEPPPLDGWPRKLGQMMAYLDEHSMKPKLYRWRFNLKTGAVTEGRWTTASWSSGPFNQKIAGTKGATSIRRPPSRAGSCSTAGEARPGDRAVAEPGLRAGRYRLGGAVRAAGRARTRTTATRELHHRQGGEPQECVGDRRQTSPPPGLPDPLADRNLLRHPLDGAGRERLGG